MCVCRGKDLLVVGQRELDRPINRIYLAFESDPFRCTGYDVYECRF